MAEATREMLGTKVYTAIERSLPGKNADSVLVTSKGLRVLEHMRNNSQATTLIKGVIDSILSGGATKEYSVIKVLFLTAVIRAIVERDCHLEFYHWLRLNRDDLLAELVKTIRTHCY